MAIMRDIALLDEWNECTEKIDVLEKKMKTDSDNCDFNSVMKDISDMKETINYTAIVGLEIYSSIPKMQECVEEILKYCKELLDAIDKITEAY